MARSKKAATAGELRLAQLRQVAQAAGFALLATEWRGNLERYLFECRRGHQYQRGVKHLIHEPPVVCPQCLQEDQFARIQQTVQAKGGVCLSPLYMGVVARYEFQCAQGHRWTATGGWVLRGHWCRQCAYEAKQQAYRLTDGLARLQAAALKHKGACLSERYVDQQTRYRFRCRYGHEWSTTGGIIFSGQWCCVCNAVERRLRQLAVMQEVAQACGGRCLSEKYIGSGIKLEWECHRGHTWRATPANTKRGHWCPQCAILDRIHRAGSKARQKYLPSKHHVVD